MRGRWTVVTQQAKPRTRPAAVLSLSLYTLLLSLCGTEPADPEHVPCTCTIGQRKRALFWRRNRRKKAVETTSERLRESRMCTLRRSGLRTRLRTWKTAKTLWSPESEREWAFWHSLSLSLDTSRMRFGAKRESHTDCWLPQNVEGFFSLWISFELIFPA